MQEDYAFAVAAYDLYDVLFVNPTYDGMNLVAMEGPLVNRRDGVLVLSRNAGAFSRLGRQSLGVNPFDLAETAEAIREATRDAGRGTRPARPRTVANRAGAHARELARRSARGGRPGASAVAPPSRLTRESPPASTPSDRRRPTGLSDRGPGAHSARSSVTSPAGPSTTTSAASVSASGVSRPCTATFTVRTTALGEAVEGLERSQVRHVVARVEHRVESLLVDDALDRTLLQRSAGRDELDHHLAGQQLEASVARDRA